jgi:hypothetical protein
MQPKFSSMGGRLNISLLTALPHSLAEVEAAATDPMKDYVVNQLLKYYTPKQVWEVIGPHLEVAAGRLFGWCNENGIAVIRKAIKVGSRNERHCNRPRALERSVDSLD